MYGQSQSIELHRTPFGSLKRQIGKCPQHVDHTTFGSFTKAMNVETLIKELLSKSLMTIFAIFTERANRFCFKSCEMCTLKLGAPGLLLDIKGQLTLRKLKVFLIQIYIFSKEGNCLFGCHWAISDHRYTWSFCLARFTLCWGKMRLRHFSITTPITRDGDAFDFHKGPTKDLTQMLPKCYLRNYQQECIIVDRPMLFH